jgi:inorganic pyrophosphatase
MGFFFGFSDELTKLAAVQQFKTHPWHGIETHADNEMLNVYIEIVPTDTVKYELDKETGHLKVDRPQKFSNICPSPYGFIPKTYCGKRIGDFAGRAIKRMGIKGDGDPLDICVLTEKIIPHGDLVLQARPIGGLRMIDTSEADDKIIAVLKDDLVYGNMTDIREVPKPVIARLKHYFLTYKQVPGKKLKQVEITHVYNASKAAKVIALSEEDYKDKIAEG